MVNLNDSKCTFTAASGQANLTPNRLAELFLPLKTSTRKLLLEVRYGLNSDKRSFI